MLIPRIASYYITKAIKKQIVKKTIKFDKKAFKGLAQIKKKANTSYGSLVDFNLLNENGQSLNVLIENVSLNGIKPNVGDVFACEEKNGKWILSGGGSSGGQTTNESVVYVATIITGFGTAGGV